MQRILFNFLIIYILFIICCKIILVISTDIIEKTIDNIHLREKRERRDHTINLAYFKQQILTTLVTSQVCWTPCSSFSSDNLENYKFYKSNGCNGWIGECRYFTGPRDMGDARYCISADYKKTLLGVRTSFYQRYGINPEKCKGGNTYIPRDGHCFCLCTCTANGRDKSEHNWSFSSREQKSDIANNKIVAGVRFVELNNVIYLQVNEGVPGSKQTGHWRPIKYISNYTDEDYHYEYDYDNDDDDDDTDVILITYYRRTINLDEIILPMDYAITGVRFRMADDVTLRLEVQGTKFDLNEKRFLLDSQKWFNSESNSKNDTFDSTKWLPDLNSYEKTNLSLKFRPANLNEDFGKTTLPLLYSRAVQLNTNRILNAIRLCRVYWHGDETIFPQIATSNMIIRQI